MVIGIIVSIAMTQIGCPSSQFYGTHSNTSDSIATNGLTCNNNCNCSSSNYEPVCSLDGHTVFFSPCQAGCKSSEVKTIDPKSNETIKLYSECTCVEADADEGGKSATGDWPQSWPKLINSTQVYSDQKRRMHHAFAGYCPSDCQQQFFYLFGLMMFLGFVFAANRMPCLIIFMRAVNPGDKTSAFSFIVSFVSLFALIPAPLIYGAMFDNSCTIWEEKCGTKWNCLAYNTDDLRQRIGGLTAVILSMALCCEIAIWYYIKGLNIYDELNSNTQIIEEPEEDAECNVGTAVYGSTEGIEMHAKENCTGQQSSENC